MADTPENDPQPPPAQGVRLDWTAIPPHIGAKVEAWLESSVVSAESQATGFSPGVAARLTTSSGRRIFLKAIGPHPSPHGPVFHRLEAQISAALPPTVPCPRLLWFDSDEETGWATLVFETIDGRHPEQPWRSDELTRVVDGLSEMAEALTPSPLPVDSIGTAAEKMVEQISGWRRLQAQPESAARLDPWSARHLAELAEIEATVGALVQGNTLVHFDIRADNMLLTPDRVWIVDWPHACVGPAWLDLVFFAPSVTMQGGPRPEQLIAQSPLFQEADPSAVTAAIVAMAGFFTYSALQPPPPGLPTLRAFQAAQAVVAREWIAERTGWR